MSPRSVKAAAAIAFTVLLAGCAGRMVEERGAKFVGQPSSAIIAKLGVPNEERNVAGRKVYIWAASTFDEGTQYQCHFRAIIGPGDLIESLDIDGNNMFCMRYAGGL